MKFTFPEMTQTQLGKLFGVSSHVIGDWLTQIGLREDGQPTKNAHGGRFCKQAIAGEKGTVWVWDSEKTVNALISAGHLMKLNPPQTLVLPAILNGPFSVRTTDSSICVVSNADGSDCVRTNTKMTAEVLVKILNVAHQHGHIDRLCQSQRLLQATLASDDVNKLVESFE